MVEYLVRCPYCYHLQRTTAKRSRQCCYCGRWFSINPKRKLSRIVRVVKL